MSALDEQGTSGREAPIDDTIQYEEDNVNNNIYRVGLIAILATVSWFVYVFAQMIRPRRQVLKIAAVLSDSTEARTVFFFMAGVAYGASYSAFPISSPSMAHC